MKLKGIVLGLTMFVSFSSMANYESCEITNGRVSVCDAWAQVSSYPVFENGRYSDCSITNGSVDICRGWANESSVAVKNSDGIYESCSITNGSIDSCNSWFNGRATIEK